jgi:hypothetical protein
MPSLTMMKTIQSLFFEIEKNYQIANNFLSITHIYSPILNHSAIIPVIYVRTMPDVAHLFAIKEQQLFFPRLSLLSIISSRVSFV